MGGIRAWLKQFALARGYSIGRIDPNSSLGLYVVSMLRHFGITCVFDVGAHFGKFGAELRTYGYKGRIVSFEPVGANFAVLQQRCAPDPDWTAHNIALGAQEAAQPINVTKNTVFSSFREPSAFATNWYADSATARSEIVTVKRLDDIFQECTADLPNPQVYLKLDTQGWDLEVLKGATGCLPSIRALQSEMSVVPVYEGMPGYLEAITWYNRLGFQLSAMYAVSRDAELRLVEFDCVMVQADAPATVPGSLAMGMGTPS
jgi:FkbM family methyltransferase